MKTSEETPLGIKLSQIIRGNVIVEGENELGFVEDAAFDIEKEVRSIAINFAQKSNEQMIIVLSGGEYKSADTMFDELITQMYSKP